MKPASTTKITLALLTLALLAGCSEAPESQPAPSLRTYVHAMDGAPATLDPGQASNLYANTLVINLYDTLYRYRYLARPYELAPNLAADLPTVSEDGLTLTIRLKPGVRFIDDPAFPGGVGREVIAQDVVYSLLRHFDPESRAQGAWLWRDRLVGLDDWKEAGADYDTPPEGLRALDDHTLQLTLTRPYPQIVHTLAQGYAAVVPREAVERYGRELGVRAVGSGPFRLESFDRSRAVLVRNDAYRQEPVDLAAEGFDPSRDGDLGLEHIEGRAPPFMDRIEVEFIAEDAARWNSYYAGETHFIKVPVAQFDQVLASRSPATLAPELLAEHRFDAAPEAGFVYTSFNMADPNLGHHPDPAQAERNRALRCAMVKAFDWDRRNAQFYGDMGQVFPGVIPPVVPEFDAGLDRASVTRDLEEARALLREHGWTAENLPELGYGFPSSVTERQLFEQFRSFMGDIGYPADKLRPQVYATFGDYYRAYSQGEVGLITTGWTLDYPDAENTLQLFYGPNASPGANNGSFRDETFDALYEEAAVLEPSAERTRLFAAMNQRVIDECAAITGLTRSLLLLWNRDLVMRPDRAFVGGYAFRFVDRRPQPEP
ncbi:MAG: ABC transporter substrate-binding protein [Xanthomonadales bacterium]|jgi:ABC-type transport system substrate-binding protein|nr:ABC transporter substrate-binding protein [Xanthomonadales bacterium]